MTQGVKSFLTTDDGNINIAVDNGDQTEEPEVHWDFNDARHP